MKTKKGKIILCSVTMIFSIISACIGMGLLRDSGLSFGWRVLCGCCFVWVPILVEAMINTMFKN